MFVAPHYIPLTSRTRFSPERIVAVPATTSVKIFEKEQPSLRGECLPHLPEAFGTHLGDLDLLASKRIKGLDKTPRRVSRSSWEGVIQVPMNVSYPVTGQQHASTVQSGTYASCGDASLGSTKVSRIPRFVQPREVLDISSDHEDCISAQIGRVRTTVAHDKKISKPSGTLGKSGSNGYSLEAVVDWDAATFRDIQDYICNLAKEYLKIELPFYKQDTEAKSLVCQLASQAYPILSSYSDDWVTMDIMKGFLKNTSQRVKRKKRSHAELTEEVSVMDHATKRLRPSNLDDSLRN